jgi:hypothetical protein
MKTKKNKVLFVSPVTLSETESITHMKKQCKRRKQ